VMVQVTTYSMITSVFQSEIAKYIAYIEIAVGLGVALGPTVGSVVYTFYQYEKTMYFFGFVNLVGLLTCAAFIPNSMNKTASAVETFEIESGINEENSMAQKTQKQKELGILSILKNKDSAFAAIMLLIGSFDLCFFSGFLAIEFVKHGLNKNNVGYIMGS
jgi:MFS family permease